MDDPKTSIDLDQEKSNRPIFQGGQILGQLEEEFFFESQGNASYRQLFWNIGQSYTIDQERNPFQGGQILGTRVRVWTGKLVEIVEIFGIFSYQITRTVIMIDDGEVNHDDPVQTVMIMGW